MIDLESDHRPTVAAGSRTLGALVRRSAPLPILLTGLGIFVAVLGVLVTWFQYERSKRHFALTEIVARWNENTGRIKDTIEGEYPGIYNQERFDVLGEDEARQLFEANEGSELYVVRQSLVELLNYFEFIAMVCESDVADEAIVREFAGTAMVRWGKTLRVFLRVYNEERKRSVWGPFYAIVDRWGLGECLFYDHQRCPRARRGVAHGS